MPPSLAPLISAVSDELFHDGNVEAIERWFTPDYVAHLTDGDMTGGHPAIRRVVSLYRSAVPDLEVQVELLVEAGDRVTWARMFRGTQRGAYKGFPATGRPIAWREMVTSRFVDGRIAEEWVVTDLAERLLLGRKALTAGSDGARTIGTAGTERGMTRNEG